MVALLGSHCGCMPLRGEFRVDHCGVVWLALFEATTVVDLMLGWKYTLKFGGLMLLCS